MNHAAAWDDPGLGRTRGLGNDRPDGPAELVSELEPGLAVVRYCYDNSRIDAAWSVHEARGFAWWGHRLAQRVWSEPGYDDAGIEIFRLVARTSVARGVTDLPRALRGIDALNMMATTSALILDVEAGTVDLVASAWVHEQTVGWVARLFSIVAAMQAAQAHVQADAVAAVVGGEPAISAHPRSGDRSEPDEMLGVLDVFARSGAEPSMWVGPGFVEALTLMRGSPSVPLATGDESALTIEVAYESNTSLIQLGTREPHPMLGNGLLLRCSLPHALADGPEWAAAMNRRELAATVAAPFLGSWVGSASLPTFVAFYPNLAATSVGAANVALGAVNRMRWAAGLARPS